VTLVVSVKFGLTLMNENRLWMFKKRVKSTIFWHKREEEEETE